MWTCPVCNQLGDTLLCPNCSFDISCDLEHYPTLTKPSTLPKTIAQRNQRLRTTLRCPHCGQYAFQFDYVENLLTCIQCGYSIPLELNQAQHKKPDTPANTQQEDTDALNDLGNRYYLGQGVPRDYAKAVEYYRKAADQGLAVAQYNIGSCYYHGNGVAKNYAKAVEFFRKAAEQGDADAQSLLGWCYYNGNGVDQDIFKAVEYFQLAKDQEAYRFVLENL